MPNSNSTKKMLMVVDITDTVLLLDLKTVATFDLYSSKCID